MVELEIAYFLRGVGVAMMIVGFGGAAAYLIKKSAVKHGAFPPADWEPPIGMRLAEAKLCLDCDLVFTGIYNCPGCTSPTWVYINHWLSLPDEEADACSEHCDERAEKYYNTCND